jgi:phosphoglycerol transferase MdoB-like AlkP superfamily enzyme
MFFFKEGIVSEALAGFAGDVVLINLILIILYFPYRALSSFNPRWAAAGFIFVTILYFIVVAPVQMFYLLTHEIASGCYPDGGFIFVFKAFSTGKVLFSMAVVALIGAFWLWFIARKQLISLPLMVKQIFIFFLILAIPAAFELGVNSDFFNKTPHRINKHFYFVKTGTICLTGSSKVVDNTLTGVELLHHIKKEKTHLDKEGFPLLHQFEKQNCLSDYFAQTESESKPDIVLLVVEGLGNGFISPMHGISFMPYLEQLRNRSLYWDHFLSPVQEGIPVLPSILGGLPFGEKGFSEIEKVPYHFSLVNVLRRNGYHTSFFYGRWVWEQVNAKFLNQNHMDMIWDAGKFGTDIPKVYTQEGTYHWGYNDRDLLEAYFSRLPNMPSAPRFDIVYTSSARSPFAITDTEQYRARFLDKISEIPEGTLREYLLHMDSYFMSLMFGDDMISTFMTQYQKSANADNTIFIITGSYPILEFSDPHPLKRYHVPLIIYSPKLKEGATFSHVSSHNDLYGTLLSFLGEEYKLDIPALSSALGHSLCPSSTSGSRPMIPFMKPLSAPEDLLLDEYFLFEGKELYNVGKDFDISPVDNDQKLENMLNVLDAFRQVNKQSAINLIPDSIYFDFNQFEVLLDTLIPRQRIRGEYFRIIERRPVANARHTIDLTFRKPEVSLNEVFVVFEIQNEEGQVVQWKNYGIPVTRDDFNFSINVGEHDTEEPLYLQLYIWNESPLPYSFGELRATLYRTSESLILNEQ